MLKLDTSYRVAASVLFLMAAAGPIVAWGTYLFGGGYRDWRNLLESALSAENEYLYFFVLLLIGGVFSLISAVIVAVQRRRVLLRAVVVGGIVQSLVYAAVGAWFLSFAAVAPLWFTYKVGHEV